MKTVVISLEELITVMDERIAVAFARNISSHEPRYKRSADPLTRHEVARKFQVSLVTINKWCAKGILRPVRMNSRVYFLPEDVEDELNRKKKKR